MLKSKVDKSAIGRHLHNDNEICRTNELRRPRGNEEPHLGRRFAPRLVTYGAELFIDWGHRQVNFGDQCIVSQNSSFFSLYTSNGPVLLWAFFMGARIVLYVVVALLIGSSVVLAVHSLRDH